jgi:hypothetical protein
MLTTLRILDGRFAQERIDRAAVGIDTSTLPNSTPSPTQKAEDQDADRQGEMRPNGYSR